MIKGLKRALEVIKREKEYAIQANPVMALGMSQVCELIGKEIDVEEKKEFNQKSMSERNLEFINNRIEELNKINSEATGGISDGAHTFDELYNHRMILFSIICNSNSSVAWKSWKHHDGTMYEDYFIVGITTEKGDYSYHYHKDNWGKFCVKELEFAPEWDGHKASDIDRLYSLL